MAARVTVCVSLCAVAPGPPPRAAGGGRGRARGPGSGARDPPVPPTTGISSPVKKTEMDKSPFNSPSPQDSPRLSSFTQHHRPVIAVHSGEPHGPGRGAAWPLWPGKSHWLCDHKSYCDSRARKPGGASVQSTRAWPVSLGLSFPFYTKRRGSPGLVPQSPPLLSH